MSTETACWILLGVIVLGFIAAGLDFYYHFVCDKSDRERHERFVLRGGGR